ncbi:DUF3302 domain-containing protein [Psychromonas sp. SA13A]|uniref:DUF3302 domain-containing protein n=1 Tax=Psychromonas sp. SA13A TaxID=2686346 RepID=UPI00140D02F6|nr:DUF3302 domain-containing protein [Psychromonas sp. SA13A]
MLEYIALGILVFIFVTLFYGMVAIHDIPYKMAKERNHPQQDALQVAGWISLLTLHILWPFLWIWATSHRQNRSWGGTDNTESVTSKETNLQLINLQNLINLQHRVETIETALSIKSSEKVKAVAEKNIASEDDIDFKVDNEVEDFDKQTSQLFEDIDKLNLEQQQGDK